MGSIWLKGKQVEKTGFRYKEFRVRYPNLFFEMTSWFFNVLSVKHRYTGYNFPVPTSTEYTIFPLLPFKFRALGNGTTGTKW